MASTQGMTRKALLLAGLFMTVGASAWANDAGQVQVVVGSAKAFDSTGKARELRKGMTVQEGDRIVTGDDTLVQLKLRDGSYLSVRTNTDMTIARYNYETASPSETGMILRLAQGALRSITGLIARKNPLAYSIQTPSATIGIRGTDHEPVHIPEPKPGETPMGTPGTYDKVNSGQTFIRTTTGTIDIRPGQVGFAPVLPKAVPAILPKPPEFFRSLDAKERKIAREGREAGRQEDAGQRPGKADGGKRPPPPSGGPMNPPPSGGTPMAPPPPGSQSNGAMPAPVAKPALPPPPLQPPPPPLQPQSPPPPTTAPR